jgi:FkbM family methyltransferase
LEYEIFKKGEYSFLENKISSAKCIFDIWWHIWLFSQWCRTLNQKAKIHYFEPVEQFYTKAKTKLWDDQNVILNNYGISSQSESWTILLNEEKTMQSSKYSSFLNPNWKAIKSEFIPLWKYLKENNIEKIDILKMDIEWMEFEVLSSRWDYERKRIDNFVAEIHLLNEDFKSEWNQIFLKIKWIFWNIRIIDSWYCDEIFLLWAYKF